MPLGAELLSCVKCWNGLVDLEALDVPWKDELGSVFQNEIAYRLDEGLRNAARARAIVERQMGIRLARLRDVDGFIRLGFARLGDYATERLQINTRTAQEMARVAVALEALPALRRASDEGVLNSSKVRELVRVATPENEGEWIEWATEPTVRALREEIKIRRALESGAQATGLVDYADEDTETDETRVDLRIAATPRLSAKWMTALSDFRKFEGRQDLPAGAAVEAFAADFLSGPEGPETTGEEDPGLKGTETSDDVPECQTFNSTALGRAVERAAILDRRNRVERGIEEETNLWELLDDGEPGAPTLPPWLEQFQRECRSTDPFDIDKGVFDLGKARAGLQGMTGRMLFVMSRLDLFRGLHFLDLGHYARERLGMSASEAAKLMWIEKRLFEVPKVQYAYYKNEIGLSKVQLLLRLMEARDINAWLERAKKVTVSRLKQEVEIVLKRVALLEAGLLPGNPKEDAYEVLPEGTDLVLYMSALDDTARKSPEGAKEASGPKVTIRVKVETGVAELWDQSVDRCRALFGKYLTESECADRILDAFFAAYERKYPKKYGLNYKVFKRDGWR
jgi:hypothetical protein